MVSSDPSSIITVTEAMSHPPLAAAPIAIQFRLIQPVQRFGGA
jgi:hypothetical protein